MKYVYLFLLLIITLPAMANNKVSGEDIVQKATQYSGIRYTPGGSNPKRGFDCSGFVSYVFRKLDISVPRSSASLFVRTNKFQTTKTCTWATWYFQRKPHIQQDRSRGNRRISQQRNRRIFIHSRCTPGSNRLFFHRRLLQQTPAVRLPLTA